MTFSPNGRPVGGNSGQMLLRFLGWDAFVTSKGVVACLSCVGWTSGRRPPTSKGNLIKVQEQFNAWAKEIGLPYAHLSRICAMSIGENDEADKLANMGGGGLSAAPIDARGGDNSRDQVARSLEPTGASSVASL